MNIGASVLDVAVAVGIILVTLLPVALFVGLIWVAVRHLQGHKTVLDPLFNGIGRAAAMNWHLQAGGPHPDDAAVPVPPPPGPRPRVRRRPKHR